jgi:hypothetical protein
MTAPLSAPIISIKHGVLLQLFMPKAFSTFVLPTLLAAAIILPSIANAIRPPDSWHDRKLGDVDVPGFYEADTQTCTYVPSVGDTSSKTSIQFTGSEVKEFERQRMDSGFDGMIVQRSIVLATDPQSGNPCDLKIESKTQATRFCMKAPAVALPVPPVLGAPPVAKMAEDFETGSAMVRPNLALPVCTNAPTAGFAGSQSVSRAILGEYRVHACCYDWWLTYQKSQLRWNSDGTNAAYTSGEYYCDGNGHHGFFNTQCDYQNWIPGPAPEVSFESYGHYVQPPPFSPYNYDKTVGVQGRADAGGGCTFDIGGSYPGWVEHEKNCYYVL